MKVNDFPRRRSVFWSRLLGLLIAFAIILVMLVGGVKNLMGELSAVHEALMATQIELVTAEHELAQTQAALEEESRALQIREQQLKAAGNTVLALTNERNQLKHRWGNTLRALHQRNHQVVAADQKLRETQRELQRLKDAPQVSMIVTSERQLHMSQREFFAMSHARMMFQSDAGTVYYEGMEAMHEIEKHVSYAERTQVVITQTLPGHDVLECLADPSKQCGAIVATQFRARQLEYHAYQSQYRSAQLLLAG